MTRAPICIEAFRIPEKMPGNPLDRVCQGDGNVCQLMTTHQEASKHSAEGIALCSYHRLRERIQHCTTWPPLPFARTQADSDN